jgi:endonuclease/exonuclease/phosphatase family metal-dependent hydrolase
MQRRTLIGGFGAVALAAGCRARVSGCAPVERPASTLRVMTLNLAHGRGRAPSQSWIRDPNDFRRNLDAVAEILRRENPDVVALQEAEFGSSWAGDFDHVGYLADRAGYGHVAATPHMRETGRYRYGTAVISRRPVIAQDGGDFETQSRWRKGFTKARVALPGGESLSVLAVHLDLASANRRRAQLSELAAFIGDANPPMVVMGDFNTTWTERDRSGLAEFAARLKLRPWAPELKPRRDGVGTFRGMPRRLDWILVSEGLHFANYATLGDEKVSDHVPVLADLRIRSEATLAVSGRRGPPHHLSLVHSVPA